MNARSHILLATISALLLVPASPGHAQPAYSSHMAMVGLGESHLAGSSVAAAGDVNDDGHPDYIVAIPFWDGGHVRIFSGPTGDLIRDITMPIGLFGVVVNAAGDVDNDGVDDVIVGSPYEWPSGTAHVFSGATGGVLHAIAGVGDFADAGTAACPLGDVDGDGHDDFAVGYPGEPGGVVRVHSGAPGAPVFHTLTGAGGLFGTALANIGDIDMDGVIDLAVGAPFEAGSSGAVRVYSGNKGTLMRTIPGAPGEGLGFAIARAGDIDNDNVSDMIVGAPYASGNTGGVRIYSGATGEVIHDIIGEVAGSYFGIAVDGLGDVDGDGTDDVIVGAPSDNRGQATIYSGATGQFIDYSLGRTNGGQYASAVCGAGDLNADGRPDFIVGAVTDGTNGFQAGAAYVYMSVNQSAPPPALCPGDSDGNQTVNFNDIINTLANYGATCR